MFVGFNYLFFTFVSAPTEVGSRKHPFFTIFLQSGKHEFQRQFNHLYLAKRLQKVEEKPKGNPMFVRVIKGGQGFSASCLVSGFLKIQKLHLSMEGLYDVSEPD